MSHRDCLYRPDRLDRRHIGAPADAPATGALLRKALVRSVDDAVGHIDQLMQLEQREMDQLTAWRFLVLRGRLERLEDLVDEATGDWAAQRAG
jgi:hypothetical protein